MTRWLMCAAAVLLAVAGPLRTAGAATLTVAELQHLLQAAPQRWVAFQEQRESPWLAAPITSRGTLRSTADGLEKKVEAPRAETWRLLADRVEWVGADGTKKQILFSQAPALAPLSELMRHVVAGDMLALQRDFRIELSGDARVWRAQLTPTTAEVSRHLEQVELQGTAGQLQVVIVTERGGQRTTTRLHP